MTSATCSIPTRCIYYLTNRSRLLYYSVKVLLTVSPFRSSFLQPPALHPQNDRFLTPVFSSTSESLFSQLLCFQIYLRCPLLFSSVTSILLFYLHRSPVTNHKPRVFFGLPPLVLSCLSFSRSLPLFSVTCSLLLQNRGVGVSPRPLSPLVTRHFTLPHL